MYCFGRTIFLATRTLASRARGLALEYRSRKTLQLRLRCRTQVVEADSGADPVSDRGRGRRPPPTFDSAGGIRRSDASPAPDWTRYFSRADNGGVRRAMRCDACTNA